MLAHRASHERSPGTLSANVFSTCFMLATSMLAASKSNLGSNTGDLACQKKMKSTDIFSSPVRCGVLILRYTAWHAVFERATASVRGMMSWATTHPMRNPWSGNAGCVEICSILSWYGQNGPNVVVFSRSETAHVHPRFFDSGDGVPPLGFSALGMTIPQLSTMIVPSFNRLLHFVTSSLPPSSFFLGYHC